MNLLSRNRLFLSAAALVFAAPLRAADHGDGFAVGQEPTYDITDFFVFPHDEGGQRRLGFILSVDPKTAQLDPGAAYRIRTRPIDGFAYGPFTPKVRNQEISIDCRSNKTRDHLSCTLSRLNPKGRYDVVDTAEIDVGDRSGGKNSSFKVFAGKAADQLFSDRARVRMPVWEDRGFNGMIDGKPEWPGVNSQAGKNVMSIVVDLDASKYYSGDVGLLAAVGETLHVHPAKPNGEPEKLIQIDRMGRVEVTVFILRDTNNPLRDLWNKEDTFNINPDHIPAYRAGLQEGLERLDLFELSLKGTDVHDWPVPHPWVDLMMHDFLIVDLRCPVAPSSSRQSYLKIEDNAFRFVTPSKSACEVGGRVPNEDVIDTTLTVFINGLNSSKPSRGVGVPAPDRLSVDAFPFVGEPFAAAGEQSY